MPHFFINSNQLNNSEIKISDKENYTHIARSLRAKKGEKLFLIDENKIQYETIITQIDKTNIIAKIIKKYPSTRILDFELYLAQSPLRSDGQNFLVEKATELGVSGIYPIKTDNCTLNNETIDKKIPKWQKIMQEASKQCERANIPTCFNRTTIEELIENEKFDTIWVFCERIATDTIHKMYQKKHIKKGEKILIFIGPEGGFSKNEFDYFLQNNFPMLTLGNLILKAETATIVALGNIIYEYSTYKK